MSITFTSGLILICIKSLLIIAIAFIEKNMIINNKIIVAELIKSTLLISLIFLFVTLLLMLVAKLSLLTI